MNIFSPFFFVNSEKRGKNLMKDVSRSATETPNQYMGHESLFKFSRLNLKRKEIVKYLTKQLLTAFKERKNVFTYQHKPHNKHQQTFANSSTSSARRIHRSGTFY